MAESVRVRAAAKVNLHLRVYGRRKDGFHGILSLFQAVSLADSIVIRSLKESDTIEIDGDFDCPAEETTVYKAVVAYRAASGIKTGLSLKVDKRIPAGAGLGGGSSDAAATLLGLQAILNGGLEPSKIAALGASLGSDVPFFLLSAAAIVSGRGEDVRPIEARGDYSLVIAFPGFPVSTVGAYALLDRERPDDAREPDPGPEELIRAYRGDIRQWPFANSFEPVIGASRPEIPKAKAIFLEEGASFAAMSGSGSSIFGVFEGGARIERAKERLSAAGFAAYSAAPLARCLTLD
jgi:4-diphosphocytidyl-2-C-methyl-D-erythritol kinase